MSALLLAFAVVASAAAPPADCSPKLLDFNRYDPDPSLVISTRLSDHKQVLIPNPRGCPGEVGPDPGIFRREGGGDFQIAWNRVTHTASCESPRKPGDAWDCRPAEVWALGEGCALTYLKEESIVRTKFDIGVAFEGRAKVLDPRTSRARLAPKAP